LAVQTVVIALLRKLLILTICVTSPTQFHFCLDGVQMPYCGLKFRNVRSDVLIAIASRVRKQCASLVGRHQERLSELLLRWPPTSRLTSLERRGRAVYLLALRLRRRRRNHVEEDQTKGYRRDRRKQALRKMKKSGMSVFTIFDVLQKRARGEKPINLPKKKGSNARRKIR
jgi:hypothetical protein